MIRRTSWPSARERRCLQLGVLDDAAPERPREGDHDSDLHSSTESMVRRSEARRHPPRHPDHRRRAAERRLLHARARPAAREEDGQPGRPDRLPPLLRRRARQRRRRHHVLRVPGRAARAGRRGDGAHDHAGGSASEDALDFWEERLHGEAGAIARDGRPAALRGPRGPRARARCRRRPATSRSSPGIRRSRRSTRSRASTACARSRVDPERSRPLLEERARSSSRAATNEWEARGERRGGFYGYDPRPRSAGSAARAPSTTSPGPRRWRSTRPGASGSPRPARSRRP